MTILIDGSRSGIYRGVLPPHARDQRALEEAKRDVTQAKGENAVTPAQTPEKQRVPGSYRRGNIIIG